MNEREIWVGPDGTIITGVHSKDDCVGRACCLHNPSDHKMRDWPLHYRNDRALMERICPHGIGHPDPDDLAYNEMMVRGSSWARGIHGCDGCCLGQDQLQRQRRAFEELREIDDLMDKLKEDDQ